MAMKVVRFVVRGGHLEPLEPLTLAEGTEVNATVELPEAAPRPNRVLRPRHLGAREPLDPIEGSEVDLAVSVRPDRGSPAAILAAMREEPHIDRSTIDELERAIEAGKIPVRREGAFDGEGT